jgi:two-component system, cell cycle sensor histidine kinase and response regulator CckA
MKLIMKEGSKYLYQALDSLEEPLFVLNPEHECVFANRALYELLIPEQERCKPVSVQSFWPEITEADLNLREIYTRFCFPEQGIGKVRLTVCALADEYRLCVVTASAFKGSIPGYFHSQRLETLGMLSGGIAHDFNNVLAGILGHITYLKTILPNTGPHVESLAAIEDGGRKASLLIQEILSFSKLDIAAEPVSIDICSLVERTCRLLRGGISPRYNLEYKIPDQKVFVLGVEGRLAQVIVNLVINSRDAIEADGNIIVKLEVPDNTLYERKPDSNQADSTAFAKLEVSDDGIGMSEEIQMRILEPYFSTKADHGTGLGLATVDTIVRDAGGKISVDSKVGGGTTISVLIPLAEDIESSDSQASSPVESLLRGNESILIVDDEDPVRNVLCVSLIHLGYNVDIAASGSEAIQKFRDKGCDYDLIILDMLMPGFSGDEVFFQLKEIRSEVRVLVISGYSSESAVQKILDNGGLGFIQSILFLI